MSEIEQLANNEEAGVSDFGVGFFWDDSASPFTETGAADAKF